MKITIKQPLGFSGIGEKENQEDSVYPLFDKVTEEQRCFLLCDGVGGCEHGEVASRTACDTIGKFIDGKLSDDATLNQEDIQQAVSLAYDELEAIDNSEEQNRMGTTLTCICFCEDGVFAAHMGDSRIYQVRAGVGIIYQSADHSLVNALLQAGELTPEEVNDFPRKNVITKALQPHPKKRYNAEVHLMTDILPNDYFFLCSDGVLEQLTNDRLVEILSMPIDDKKKIGRIEAECLGKTKDNFTAYLIPVRKVKGKAATINDEITDVHNDEITDVHIDNFSVTLPSASRWRSFINKLFKR